VSTVATAVKSICKYAIEIIYAIKNLIPISNKLSKQILVSKFDSYSFFKIHLLRCDIDKKIYCTPGEDGIHFS
jgi:hypothetical protein